MNSSTCFALPLPLFFFVFLFLGINITLEVEAAPTYLHASCPNTTLFTSNSTYKSNLNTLLSTLSSSSTSAAVAASGFSNATSGSASTDKAYGLFLCRGDVSNATCSDCVATATQEILQRCPNQGVSVIWYDECMLRYSNQAILSVVAQEPSFILYNVMNITDVTRFTPILADALNKSANQASNGVSKKVGAVQTNFTSLQDLYVLTQCTPDLSSSDCYTCLRGSFGRLSPYANQQGARVLMPSCQVRFEFYPFYNTSAIPAAPSPPAPSPTQVLPPPGAKGKSKNSTVIIIVIVIPAALALVVFFLACCLLRRRARRTYEAVQGETGVTELSDVQSLQFDFTLIQAATGNFFQENKLGEGGFGEVFKGRLTNGQEVAVKRLSQSSGQGVQEFKNEVLLVAKLQHRNLVRLLGFCLEGQEKLLVYEFVPNRSLDYFLFDPEKSRELDWLRRHKIIVGIARGMLYLHEDSRLRIIHRDLKASNILLDSDMNPKISDFGMARIFGVEQTQGNTRKIVGTFGYMSPEYAMHGQFSVKSDVYSFGILLLEIVSGRKNSSFYETDGGRDLASYAWKHWKDGTPLEVLDRSIRESYSTNEVIRCIHIGLLCVQEDPADRPTMTSIVLMLNSYSVSLQMPEEPAFFLPSRTEQSMSGLESDQSKSKSRPVSVNEVSITEVYPR